MAVENAVVEAVEAVGAVTVVAVVVADGTRSRCNPGRPVVALRSTLREGE